MDVDSISFAADLQYFRVVGLPARNLTSLALESHASAIPLLTLLTQ